MTGFDRGTRLLESGSLAQAASQFEEFLLERPDSEEGWLFYAICLTRLKRIGEAKDAFLRTLALNQDCYDALTWMGEISKEEGNFQAGVDWGQRASRVAPDRAEAYGVLGSCYLRQGRVGEAITALKKTVSLAQSIAQYHHYLGLAYGMAQRHDRASEHLRRAIQLAPRNPQSYIVLASSYSRFGLIGQALDVLRDGLSKMPNNAALHTHAAAAFTLIRNDRAAEAHHLRAIELSPDARSGYALWLTDQGRYDEALAIYEKLIQETPRLGVSYYGILQCRKLNENDRPLLAKMEALIDDPNVLPVSRMYLNYAVAKAWEQMNEFGAAMKCYDEANRLAYESQANSDPFHLPSLQASSDRVFRRYEELRERGVWGLHGPSPIFIIGMIRSGTTLLDQIVSSHPLVSNAGELRFWIEKSHALIGQEEPIVEQKLFDLAQEYLDYVHHLVGDCACHTDKMPLDFFYVGIIHRAFPNARFLHIRRHPVDTCISIYTTYFGGGSNFVYNKANTVAYYREYLRVMDYWRKHLPSDRLFELTYEDLISNRDSVIRQVVEFCGLPWDNACLHHEENKSAINTPSRWQARQPLYRSSLQRWKNYEPWLGEFESLLPDSASTS